MEILAGIDMMENSQRAVLPVRDRQVIQTKSEVFEKLMTHHKQVFLICLGFSRNASDAQDLAQEAYLRAYKNIHTLSEQSLAKFWLFRIARNTCLNFQRRNRRNRISFPKIAQSIDLPGDPESEMIHRERLHLLKDAIQNLPKKQRDVFVLKEYGDLSYMEIAETMRIEPGTVMSRLNRARQAIKEKMKGA